MNKEGAIAGMVIGILSMLFDMFGGGTEADWWFGISPEGFGTVAMMLNFVVAIIISSFTVNPPEEVQEIVENIRIPNGMGEAVDH